MTYMSSCCWSQTIRLPVGGAIIHSGLNIRNTGLHWKTHILYLGIICAHANKSWHGEVCEMCKSVETAATTWNFLLAMFHSLIALLKLFFIYDTRHVVSKCQDCLCVFWVMTSELSEEKKYLLPRNNRKLCQMSQLTTVAPSLKKMARQHPWEGKHNENELQQLQKFPVELCCNRKSSSAETEASSQTRKTKGLPQLNRKQPWREAWLLCKHTQI